MCVKGVNGIGFEGFHDKPIYLPKKVKETKKNNGKIVWTWTWTETVFHSHFE